jgi:hypothetical protein
MDVSSSVLIICGVMLRHHDNSVIRRQRQTDTRTPNRLELVGGEIRLVQFIRNRKKFRGVRYFLGTQQNYPLLGVYQLQYVTPTFGFCL